MLAGDHAAVGVGEPAARGVGLTGRVEHARVALMNHLRLVAELRRDEYNVLALTDKRAGECRPEVVEPDTRRDARRLERPRQSLLCRRPREALAATAGEHEITVLGEWR